MIIDFLREFVGQPPELLTIANLPALFEYISAVCILVGVVYLILHCVFSLMTIFKKGR